MRWLSRLLACALGCLAGGFIAKWVFLLGGPAGVVLLSTAAGIAVAFAILNATFSRAGISAVLHEAAEPQRCILLFILATVANACFVGAVYIFAFSWMPTLLLSMGGPRLLELQITHRSLIYFVPALVVVLLAVLASGTDFFLSRNETWRSFRDKIEEHNALYVGGSLFVALFTACIVALIVGYSQYLISLIIFALSIAALLAFDLLMSGSRMLGVARQMIAEAVRMKIALVFIAILVLLLPLMPFTLAGDGVTLTSRVQQFLTYSLTLSGFLLSTVTVFLACATIAGEVRGKQIWMTVSKPIPRWEFFAGKWLGIVMLDAILLLVTGLTVWGFSAYLSTRPTTVPDDRERLKTEVLSARYGVKAAKPDFSAQVDDRMRKLREEGRAGNMSGMGEADLRKQIEDDFRKSWWSIGPQTWQDYNFKGLMVDRGEDKWLTLHIKPETPTGVDDLQIPIAWRAGNSNEVDTLTSPNEYTLICGRFTTIPIPMRAVDSQGNLHLAIANTDERHSITFEGDDSFTLFYDLGTFHWNLFRALSVVWCRLAFLAVLGLLASSFVSFPVACMVTFIVLLVASISKFLMESIDSMSVRPDGTDPLYFFGPVLRPLGYAFVWIVPDFSAYDPVGNVANGQVVPIMWVLTSLVTLVLIKGLVLGIVGGAIFTRRELAQVTV